MDDGKTQLAVELFGDERAVAGLRVALNAEKGARRIRRKLLDERPQVDLIQDLAAVALDVGGRERLPGRCGRGKPLRLCVLKSRKTF